MASKYYFWKILKGIVLHKVGWVSLAYDILKDLIKYIISTENYRPYWKALKTNLFFSSKKTAVK